MIIVFSYIKAEEDAFDDNLVNEMVNYSGTHHINPQHFYEPNNVKELEALVANASKTKSKIRPVGRFLSPNGVASCKKGMVSLANCDRIVEIDKEKQQITVESGAIVDTILKELANHNLTLSNFSSIKEQQMGGWTQVAAHGTGAKLPTVDEMIVSLKVITPSKGTITLGKDSSSAEEREMFRLVRCGLGALGIVSEMTLQCMKSHYLEEITETKPLNDIYSGHIELLRDYRHVRYMWIPYADSVVIVKSNPTEKLSLEETNSNKKDPAAPLKKLLLRKRKDDKRNENIDGMSFSQLRDELIDLAPLDTKHIKDINRAEANFWNNNQGVRIGSSDEILGFDCGGQQWVLEMAFPVGTLDEPTFADLNFVTELKSKLEEANIPAPAPIEQRWTSSSTSYMSPAYSENEKELFSWVGIIMYLPPGQDDNEREKITRRFEDYADIMRTVGKKYGAVPHWAKIELPGLIRGKISNEHYVNKLNQLKESLQERYDTKRFSSARKVLDPDHILSNHLLDTLFD